MFQAVLDTNIEMAPAQRWSILWALSLFAWQQHDFEASLHYAQEAMTAAREGNTELLLADGFLGLSYAWLHLDDFTQAKEFALEALRISRNIQNTGHVAESLNQLGDATLEAGDVEQAEGYYAESYELCQVPYLRSTIFTIGACKGLGTVAWIHRDYDRALRLLREALACSDIPVFALTSLDILAGIIGTMPRRSSVEVTLAAKIWGAVEAQRETMGLLNTPQDRRRIDAMIADARLRIAPKTFATAWAEGHDLSLHEAIALAMA